jgi:hypothetical protein
MCAGGRGHAPSPVDRHLGHGLYWRPMQKNRPASQHDTDAVKPYCITCDSTVGQTRGQTMRKVKALCDGPECRANCCEQCSCEQTVDGEQGQRSLGCGGELKRVI